jgi:hypothetical protein
LAALIDLSYEWGWIEVIIGKKESTKLKRTSKSRGQNAAGNAKAAEEPAKSSRCSAGVKLQGKRLKLEKRGFARGFLEGGATKHGSRRRTSYLYQKPPYMYVKNRRTFAAMLLCRAIVGERGAYAALCEPFK